VLADALTARCATDRKCESGIADGVVGLTVACLAVLIVALAYRLREV
jgi:hypothetical protein